MISNCVRRVRLTKGLGCFVNALAAVCSPSFVTIHPDIVPSYFICHYLGFIDFSGKYLNSIYRHLKNKMVIDLMTIFLAMMAGFLTYLWCLARQRSTFPTGPPSYPLIGSFPCVNFSNLLEEMRRLRKRYGDVYTIMISYKVSHFYKSPD